MAATETKTRIPVLAGKDICRNAIDGPGGTHCLVGWAINVFPFFDQHRILKTIAKTEGISDVVAFNNSESNSTEKVAGAWNKAMKSLGFVRRGKWFVKPRTASATDRRGA